MNEPELFEIPIHTWLKPSTYRAYETLAKQHETTIAVLLARLAEQALKPKAGSRVTGTRYVERIRELHAQGWSDNRIAKALGVTATSIGNQRRKLRLPANFTPFGGTK